MRLGTKGRYGVMAMVDLARHADSRPVCIAEIAERQNISSSYLEQLFAKLRRSGLVESARGPGGGYKLARASEDILIADIFAAVGEVVEANRYGQDATIAHGEVKARCLTHDLWDELGNQIYLFLNSISLKDVVERRGLGISGRLHHRENSQLVAE